MEKKPERSAIFYLNTKTGEFKGYTSLKSFVIDKTEFKINTIYGHFSKKKSNLYTKGEHNIYKTDLHTYTE